jgi:hypothetical protein
MTFRRPCRYGGFIFIAGRSMPAVQHHSSNLHFPLTFGGGRADMVGHTGDLPATARACTLVDSCVKDLLAVVEKQGGRWLITSDHGNADDMVQRNKKDQQPIQQDGKNAPLTSHTLVSLSRMSDRCVVENNLIKSERYREDLHRTYTRMIRAN